MVCLGHDFYRWKSNVKKRIFCSLNMNTWTLCTISFDHIIWLQIWFYIFKKKKLTFICRHFKQTYVFEKNDDTTKYFFTNCSCSCLLSKKHKILDFSKLFCNSTLCMRIWIKKENLFFEVLSNIYNIAQDTKLIRLSIFEIQIFEYLNSQNVMVPCMDKLMMEKDFYI